MSLGRNRPQPDLIGLSNNARHPTCPAFWLRELRERLEDLDLPWTYHEERKRSAQATFLAAFVQTAGVTLAAGMADRTVATFEKWLAEDPIFATAYEKALTGRSEVLNAEARRRAVDGVEVEIRDKRTGEVIGTERRYDTPLLKLLMQAMGDELGRNRFAPQAAANGVNADETWRAVFTKIKNDPEALAAVDRLADAWLGEKQAEPEPTEG